MRRHSPAARTTARSGFTLVEVLVVISILAILAALVTPAVMSARSAAQVADAQTDIRALAAGIAGFKGDIGTEPPSYIILYETGTAWTAGSKAKIRAIWPNFNFALDRDINRNGNTTDTLTLNGAECLVFFLGGIMDSTGQLPQGFAKNPANPFAPAGTSGSRQGPYYDFKTSRLVDDDNDRMRVLLDPIPGQSVPYSPLMYISSNEGRGYPTGTELTATLTVSSSDDLNDIYRISAGGAAHNPNSFQIISAGLDHIYGNGGAFDPNATNSGLTAQPDYDNITNFHSGKLTD